MTGFDVLSLSCERATLSRSKSKEVILKENTKIKFWSEVRGILKCTLQIGWSQHCMTWGRTSISLLMASQSNISLVKSDLRDILRRDSRYLCDEFPPKLKVLTCANTESVVCGYLVSGELYQLRMSWDKAAGGWFTVGS